MGTRKNPNPEGSLITAKKPEIAHKVGNADLKNPHLAIDWTALDSLVIKEKSLRDQLQSLIQLWERAIEAE